MSRLQSTLKPTGVKTGLIITACSVLIYALGIQFFHMMELKAFDLHFMSRGTVEPGGEVVIVAIDEKSLDQYGRWPWPRHRIARLVERLGESGARVAAFDMVFSEPDTGGVDRVVGGLKDWAGERYKDLAHIIEVIGAEGSGDSSLVESLGKNPSVVVGYFFFMTGEEVSHINTAAPAEARPLAGSTYSMRRLERAVPEPELPEARGVEANLPEIGKASGGLGFFNTIPDPDGIVRRAPLAIRYGGSTYPHLSVEALRMYLGAPALVMNVAGYGVKSISIGDRDIPTDERGYLIINYRGPRRTFPHYSFYDVAEGLIPASVFKDKLVLVGATASGIYDMRAGPFAGSFAGVEVHANIIETILRADYISRPDWIIILDILAIVIPGVLLSLVLPLLTAFFSAVATIATAAACIAVNGYVFNRTGIWVVVVYPVFTIFFVSASVTTFQYMTAERKKRLIRDAFSQYVSPTLVQQIANSPERLVLWGEERRLTVLFCDIRGFTTIAEGLEPKALVRLMNEYLTPMTEIILENGGTIDKYMGDSIMAFWGAPVWQEDHSARACLASLRMHEKLVELKDVWASLGVEELDIGIGISTGNLTVGNMGSRERFDYTVIGDTVNLGSRLEGMNKVYGTRVLVPKYTYEDVKGEFLFREIDLIRVKGKRLPIKIYELLDTAPGHGRLQRLAYLFESGLEAYRGSKWDDAEASFKKALALEPGDGPSLAYLERVAILRERGTPPGWDGIFVDLKAGEG